MSLVLELVLSGFGDLPNQDLSAEPLPDSILGGLSVSSPRAEVLGLDVRLTYAFISAPQP